MADLPTTQPGDKLKKAIAALSEAVQQNPDKPRAVLLEPIVIRYDLSPRECAFLQQHLADNE